MDKKYGLMVTMPSEMDLAATASRDLKQGVKMDYLKRSGDRRTSVYRFKPMSEL